MIMWCCFIVCYRTNELSSIFTSITREPAGEWTELVGSLQFGDEGLVARGHVARVAGGHEAADGAGRPVGGAVGCAILSLRS
jgi:hypothetical protein